MSNAFPSLCIFPAGRMERSTINFDFTSVSALPPLQQEGGIDDDQNGAGVMDQRAHHWIQDPRDGQNNRKEIQRHGEGEVTFDGEHHPA